MSDEEEEVEGGLSPLNSGHSDNSIGIGTISQTEDERNLENSPEDDEEGAIVAILPLRNNNNAVNADSKPTYCESGKVSIFTKSLDFPALPQEFIVFPSIFSKFGTGRNSSSFPEPEPLASAPPVQPTSVQPIVQDPPPEQTRNPKSVLGFLRSHNPLKRKSKKVRLSVPNVEAQVPVPEPIARNAGPPKPRGSEGESILDRIWDSKHMAKIPEAEDEHVQADLQGSDVLSLIHSLPSRRPRKPSSRKPRISEEMATSILAEEDHLILPLIEQMQNVETAYVACVSSLQESLDLLTFPCSYSFEPISRVKGIFWLISRTMRTIKDFNVDNDTDSIKKFVEKEVASFEQVAKDFSSEVRELLPHAKTAFDSYKKVIKESTKLFSQGLTIEQEDDSYVVGSYYKTTLAPETLNFYETDLSVVDYEGLSIEFIWSPSLSFFRSYRGKEWYCFQKLESNLQVKVLQANIQLAKNLFTEVKYIMESGIRLFEAASEHLLHPLEKEVKAAKDMTLQKVSAPTTKILRSHLQVIVRRQADAVKLLSELKAGMKWMDQVLPGVIELAALRPEEMDEYLEREHHFCVPIFAFLPMCPRRTHPFLFSDFEFMILRVPLSQAMLVVLFSNKLNRHSNNLVDLTMKIIAVTQTADFLAKQALEEKMRQRKNSRRKSSAASGDGTLEPKQEPITSTTSIYFNQPSLNVYNIGHNSLSGN